MGQEGFDKILIDPPRSGAEEVVRYLSSFGASRIVYVSLQPSYVGETAESSCPRDTKWSRPVLWICFLILPTWNPLLYLKNLTTDSCFYLTIKNDYSNMVKVRRPSSGPGWEYRFGSLGSEARRKRASGKSCYKSERLCLQPGDQHAVREDRIWAEGHSCFRIGLEMAQILAELNMDQATLVAAILYRVVREERVSIEVIEKALW